MVETEDGCREEITDATLTLHDNGEWLLEVAERSVCGDAVEEEEFEEEEGTYTAEGDTLRFSDDDGDDDEEDAEEADEEAEDEEGEEIELDDLAVGTLAADGLTVRLEDGETVVLFRP